MKDKKLEYFTYKATKNKLTIDWKGKPIGNEVIFIAQIYDKSKIPGNSSPMFRRGVLYTRTIQDGKRPVIVESKNPEAGYLLRVRTAGIKPIDLQIPVGGKGKISVDYEVGANG